MVAAVSSIVVERWGGGWRNKRKSIMVAGARQVLLLLMFLRVASCCCCCCCRPASSGVPRSHDTILVPVLLSTSLPILGSYVLWYKTFDSAKGKEGTMYSYICTE